MQRMTSTRVSWFVFHSDRCKRSMPAALAHWSNTEISLENEDDFEPEVIESIDDQDVRRTGTLVSELAKIEASTDVLVS